MTEHSCRLIDPDEIDVVGTGTREHDGKTHRVTFGRPRGDSGSVEQAYRYPVDEWSESEARAHCRAHDGILFEPATSQASGEGIELRYWAAVHSIETGAEERIATFYIMNTSLNRNRWRVTDGALEEALPTLLGRGLNCVPGYRIDHVHEPVEVGRWVRVDKPDGYALATAEVNDDVAWGKIESGDWGPVSVVIRAFKVTCSVCGEDITGAPDEHIESGEGHEVIESFVFSRVDFVDEPAYPQAGVLTIGRLAEAVGSDGGVIYPSRSKLDGAQGPRDINPKPEGKGGESMKELAELRQELEQLKAENEALKAEKEGLEERVQALEAERHEERVDAALAARTKACLVTDRQAEAERLKVLDDQTLDILREDAEKVAGKVAKFAPTGPKARFAAGDRSAFEASVEDIRERLFGHRREAEA